VSSRTRRTGTFAKALGEARKIVVDELHLLVHPIAIRTGMRLFDEGERPIPLKLISSETFKTGVLNLVYAPADSIGHATYEDA
jgi:dihydrofolate reductase